MNSCVQRQVYTFKKCRILSGLFFTHLLISLKDSMYFFDSYISCSIWHVSRVLNLGSEVIKHPNTRGCYISMADRWLYTLMKILQSSCCPKCNSHALLPLKNWPYLGISRTLPSCSQGKRHRHRKCQ